MGGAIGSLFGSGSPSQPNVQVYQPSGTTAQDSNLQTLLQQQQNTIAGANNPYTQYSPQFANVFNSLYNSPYAGGYQAAANTSGTQSTATGANALNNSTALSSGVNPLTQYSNQILQTAFDPSQALYAQNLQNTQNAANVANAQYGLTGQQAAGNLNQATTNFGIDWQAQELANQAAGLQGAAAGYGAAGTAGNNALNLGTGAAQSTLAGGLTPYSAGTNIGNAQTSALQSYINALLGPSTSAQSTIGNEQNYLNTGISASEDAASQAAQDYQNKVSNTSGLFGGIGSILGLGTGTTNSTLGGSAISSLFGGSSSSSSAGAGVGSAISSLGDDLLLAAGF